MKFHVVATIEVLVAMALFGNSVSVAAEWESTLAAAKKEGKVSVITDVTATLRDALTIEFLDPSKMVMVMTPFHRGTIFYNTKLVDAKAFKSHKDLLQPKWRGKMVM